MSVKPAPTAFHRSTVYSLWTTHVEESLHGHRERVSVQHRNRVIERPGPVSSTNGIL